MGAPPATRRSSPRLAGLGDEALACRAHAGEVAAFEALHARHRAPLLAFCRHLLGNREDGEDALQQAFLRTHQALERRPPPDAVRPWLFAIARNRCLTMLAARRDAATAGEQPEPSRDCLAEDVRRRSELRELVADLAALPADQRHALVQSELGGLSHAEIAAAIGCPTGKVRALVYQARATLIAERTARLEPCDAIRDLLDAGRGGALRGAVLRRHLRGCAPCRAYRAA
jgi:RNA polymerase sigma factor (sigma-70 family)